MRFRGLQGGWCTPAAAHRSNPLDSDLECIMAQQKDTPLVHFGKIIIFILTAGFACPNVFAVGTEGDAEAAPTRAEEKKK
jgi:hypothetical protein